MWTIWLGLKFIFPLIWLFERQYKSIYKLSKKEKKNCWDNLIASNGFLNTSEKTESSFNFTNFHIRSFESNSNLDQLEVVAWGHAIIQLVGDVGCQKCSFLLITIQPFFRFFCLLFTTKSLCFPGTCMDLNMYNSLLFCYINAQKYL